MGAFYAASVHEFLSTTPAAVIGGLTSALSAAGFASQTAQLTQSWESEIRTLRHALMSMEPDTQTKWGLLLEYPIPRRPKRIDVVLVADDQVYVLEFKTGSTAPVGEAVRQVEDYCLDLKDFHSASNGCLLTPIVVSDRLPGDGHKPTSVLTATPASLGSLLLSSRNDGSDSGALDYRIWNEAQYQPTPTIIEAARYLYAGMNVREISRSQAGSENLTKTSDAVVSAIDTARRKCRKLICFITGVPGAGKTLAGLNIVHNPAFHDSGSLGVFLSGNGPLVNVLQEALARDLHGRDALPIDEARRRVSTFIQGVHGFLADYVDDRSRVPVDHIVVFDEAQRAWDKEQSWRKFRRAASEPEMMLEIMDRHPDWAVIIALVGGGQEINSGEAGMREWGNQFARNFPDWVVMVAPELKQGSHSTGGIGLYEDVPRDSEIIENPDLHLRVSIRSYKAERLSEWVAAVLDRKPVTANAIRVQAMSEYPIVLTRDLHSARQWLRSQCRGLRRAGLVCSSGARRLRQLGIDPDVAVQTERWFLEAAEDVRSSSFLEVPASEFEVQGLELDYACLCWDLDLRDGDRDWGHYAFRGTRWQRVNSQRNRQYLVNKYRVLLTRARNGLVVFVPTGDVDDPSRNPSEYDAVAAYLAACGVQPLATTDDRRMMP